MKKLLLLSVILFVGCAIIKDIGMADNKSTAFFIIGMTEEEFSRKNPTITEKLNESGEFLTYIDGCKKKYTYILLMKIPALGCEEYMFDFKNDTLIAVYRGRNNFNREIDYSKYPGSKPE